MANLSAMRSRLVTLLGVLLLSLAALPAAGLPSLTDTALTDTALTDTALTDAVGATGAAAVRPPGAGGFASENITYHATLAADSSGIGARYHVMPDGEARFYVSGAQGLSIYNVDNPAVPVLLGRFEIPNFENEDVSVSADGRTVLMSEFTLDAYYYVFTVSDPILPSGQVLITLEGEILLEGAHIVDCIDDACDWSYGSDGDIYDLSDKSNPTLVGDWKDVVDAQNGGAGRPGGGHNVEIIGDYDLDGDGDLERVLTTDTTPITMLDVTNPEIPRLITQSLPSEHSENGTQYQHNNKVHDFASYVPRDAASPLERDADGRPTNLRTGEILLGNGETNFTVTCGSGSGPLASWSIAGWDEQEQFEVLEVFRPESGTYDGDGNAAVNALGCSGHWFDTRSPTATEIASGVAAEGDIMVAAAWYEHGTRVFRVHGATGQIEQIAYYQPVLGSASAAHWVVDGERTFIYTVDYIRGGDILSFDGGSTETIPSYEDRAFSWTVASEAMVDVAEQARWLCRLAVAQD